MSTFIDIEQALAQCGQGQFEKVVGAILAARGVRGLSLLGSVVGKEKTRPGVPDAFASIDGRSFTFAACTTETGARQVEKKLLDDVAQCADTDKTGVQVEAIDSLYLAYNSVLPPEALTRIATFAQENGLCVEFLSVSELAGDLSRRYTWIAQDFFGIQVDTGQILSVDAFVDVCNRGLLATPLNTQFLFREADLSSALDRVGNADLVIKGGPGTGKTRFALELIRKLAAQGRHVRCLHSRGLPLVQDIDRHFSDEGSYVVLLDDANRVNGLGPVVEAIRDRVGEAKVRFLFTVRIYALEEVRSALLVLCRAPEELELATFTQDETEKFLDEGFGIRNANFQRQIWRLSKGNARLATMAAKLALETQSFSAITDLTRLYDAYYRAPIERADVQGAALIPALALLSVMKSLRADNQEMISSLEQTFAWSPGSLWQAILELHRLECVDLHRNRVARVSDQILASYAFFLVFVDRRTLSFRTLVDLLGPTRLRSIRDVIFDIQNTMDQQRVRDGLAEDVNGLLHSASGQFQLKLLQAFWYFDPDFALGTVAQAIDALDPSTDPPAFTEEMQFDVVDILAVLACFSGDSTRRPLALHLALRFMAKQPSQGGEILSLLTAMHGYGIHHYSDQEEFQTQQDVAKSLRSALVAADIARDLLIRYATKMLRTEFEGSFSEGMRFTISRIRLTSGLAGPAYRNLLWEGLLECAAYPERVDPLFTLLWDYARQSRGDTDVAPVLAEDLPWVTKLFLAIASGDRPADCALATALNRRFVSVGLEDFIGIAASFESEVNQLARLLAPDWDKAAEDYEAEEKERRGRLIHTYAEKDAQTLVRLFLSATQIPGANKHVVITAWQQLLDHWAENDSTRLQVVTELGLQTPMAVEFRTFGWVGALIRGRGKEAARAVIAGSPVEVRTSWQQAFLSSLPADEISEADVEEYLAALARPGTIPLWVRDLQHYMHKSSRFLPRLIETLLTRDDAAGPLIHLLSHLDGKDLELVREQMGSESELLARAFLTASIEAPMHCYFDYNAALFDLLLDIRPEFLSEYVQAKVRRERWISRFSENHRDYGRLWKRTDWSVRLVELLEALAVAGVRTHEEHLLAWLPVRGEHGRLQADVLDHLRAVVSQYAEHVVFMQIVFSGVSDLAEDQRLELWSDFLAKNQDLDAFKALPLLPSHWGGTGSLVPVLQARVRFLERLAEIVTKPALIGHRMHVSEAIRAGQRQVDAEVESDFVERD